MPISQCMNNEVPGDCSKDVNRSFSVELKSFRAQMSSHTPHISGKTHISNITNNPTLITI